MKGITNNHPSFARICLCVLCAACISFSASAQNKSVKVNVKDVTVKELLKAIEAVIKQHTKKVLCVRLSPFLCVYVLAN